jgi:hypothetical protein
VITLEVELCIPVEPPLIGEGAAKMFDLMWFLIDRGVAASLPAKMSLLPPPEEWSSRN